MTHENYLDILLQGYIDNPDYLDKHIYRKYKEAEERKIEYIEFFDRLFLEFAELVKKIDTNPRYIEDKREYNLLVSIRKTKGEPIEDLEKPKKEDYGISFQLANGYTGNLYIHDLVRIDIACKDAFDKIRSEKTPREEPEVKQEEKEDKLNARGILRIAHIRNKGKLTSEQVETLAVKNGFSKKYLKNFYGEIWEDFKLK